MDNDIILPGASKKLGDIKRKPNEGYGMPFEEIEKDMKRIDRKNPFEWFHDVILGKKADEKKNPLYDVNRVSAMAVGLPMTKIDKGRDWANKISDNTLSALIINNIGRLFGTAGASAVKNLDSKLVKHYLGDSIIGTEKALKKAGKKLLKKDVKFNLLPNTVYKLTKDVKNLGQLREDSEKVKKILDIGDDIGIGLGTSVLVGGIPLSMSNFEDRVKKDPSAKEGLEKSLDVYSKEYVNKNKDNIDPFLIEMYLDAYIKEGEKYNRGNPDFWAFKDVAKMLIDDFNKTADGKKFIKDVLSDEFQNLLGSVDAKNRIVRDFWESQESDLDKYIELRNQMYTNKEEDKEKGRLAVVPESEEEAEKRALTDIQARKDDRDASYYRGYAPNYERDPKNWVWRNY